MRAIHQARRTKTREFNKFVRPRTLVKDVKMVKGIIAAGQLGIVSSEITKEISCKNVISADTIEKEFGAGFVRLVGGRFGRGGGWGKNQRFVTEK